MLEVRDGSMADWVGVDKCADIGLLSDEKRVNGNITEESNICFEVVFIVAVDDSLEYCIKMVGSLLW